MNNDEMKLILPIPIEMIFTRLDFLVNIKNKKPNKGKHKESKASPFAEPNKNDDMLVI